MNTTQKPAAPIASPNAKPNQPAPRATLSGGQESTCFVHRLEEALQLVESMQLTNEQKAKISQLTKAQTARCTEEKNQHKATHEQILALLTPVQHEKLQAVSDGPEHCHKDSNAALEEHALHA